MVGKGPDPERVDPEWPKLSEEDHPVSELLSHVQGAHSPYGEIEFPLDAVAYDHPHTVINR